MSAYTEHKSAYGWNEEKQKHVVLETIVWEVGKKGSLYFYEVPVGYLFDMSVPKPFRTLVNVHEEKYLKASALHDHMLEFGWLPQTASGEFLSALIADKVDFFRARIYYIFTVFWHTFLKHSYNENHLKNSEKQDT